MHGLNLDVPEHAKDIIKPWTDREDTTLFADSGVDDQVRQESRHVYRLPSTNRVQMIIHVPFSENVRVRSIVLKLGKLSCTMFIRGS